MTNEIHYSARKHGVPDEDIIHAIGNALVVLDYEDDDRMLYLGPDQAANMLEIITLAEAETELVIHAMPMQRRYQHLLRGLGE